MTDGATIYSYVLIATVYGVLFAGTVRGLRNRVQPPTGPTAQPGSRAAFFRNSIANMTILTAITVPIVALHPGLSARAVGWTLPDGDGLGHLLAGCTVVMMIVVYARSRRRLLPVETAALLPRTTGERRLAAGVSIAYGVGEEVIYRGLLLAIGTELLDLPVPLAAAAGLAVFVAAHASQGVRGMITVGLLGGTFTALYLTSASLLLPIIAHTCWDAMALLLLRPPPDTAPASEPASASEPAPAPAPAPAPEPEPEPEPEPASASASASGPGRAPASEPSRTPTSAPRRAPASVTGLTSPPKPRQAVVPGQRPMPSSGRSAEAPPLPQSDGRIRLRAATPSAASR